MSKKNREASRVVREQLAKEQRRKRTLWTAAIAAAVLVLAGLIGWGIYASQKPSSYSVPAHATSDGTGVVAGSGPATVDIYLDFMCPHCKAFEEAAGSSLASLASSGKATVVYHPVAYLDRFSTTKYSTRSAASSGCAADGNKFVEYASALFARQPAEGGPGLTDDELIQVGGSVGLVDPTFATCVRDGRYTTWVNHVNEGAGEKGVNGTPTVFVNGRSVQATADAITAAVESAAK